MKKSYWIIALLLAVVIGYVAASPLITISQIKSGIEDQDSEQLSENIDFPVLRQNLKEQLNAHLVKEATSDLENNPFGALALGFASKLVDGMVDSFITPSGLANLMEGKKPTNKSSSDLTEPEERKLFKDGRYSYDSTSRFSVWVPTDNGEELRFVIRRKGIEWKLSNIVLPVERG